jgi:hypothetical protein
MSYKVLRLLEYTYPSVEIADADMKRWEIPPIGAANKATATIRSTVMQMPGEDEDE